LEGVAGAGSVDAGQKEAWKIDAGRGVNVKFPPGFRLEVLSRRHPRRSFSCGEPTVDSWLHTKALQNQDKRLSVTKVLLDSADDIAGYYTLATGQVDFSDLPNDLAAKLPRRLLPVAMLAWLGVSTGHQGIGLGGKLLAQALRDCFEAGRTFAFIAVIVDCVNEDSRAFFSQYDFAPLPGHPFRLFISAAELDTHMKSP
jgi:hypothetical protein